MKYLVSSSAVALALVSTRHCACRRAVMLLGVAAVPTRCQHSECDEEKDGGDRNSYRRARCARAR